MLLTREPGGTRTGEIIREILQHDKAGEPLCPEAEALLFGASRAQLVRQIILPALGAGTWVVCDRFSDSTTVYQGYARGLNLDMILKINEFAINGAIPDLTILMDVPVSVGFERLSERNAARAGRADRIEGEERGFHEKVRTGYLELARRWPRRFRVVDSTRDAEIVTGEIWNAVTDVFASEIR